MIQPTIGRVVWFTPQHGTAHQNDVEQPLAALVAYVHSDRLINIGFFDQDGVAHAASSVALLQDDDAKPEAGRFCTWMPYQKGQAAKTEAAEASLAQQRGVKTPGAIPHPTTAAEFAAANRTTPAGPAQQGPRE
jgi:hypothetical protein